MAAAVDSLGNPLAGQPPDISSIIASITKNSGLNAGTGSNLFASGSNALAPALNYFSKIAGGDPNAIAEATRPQRTRVVDQYDTARKNIAQFSPRGGGANAAIAGSQVSEANDLASTTSEAQGQAASALGTLGVNQESLGLSADQLANADLNTVVQAILGQGQLKLGNKQLNTAIWGDIGKAAGAVVTSPAFWAGVAAL